MVNIDERAKEYMLEGRRDVGVVITHGFTSSPSYMRSAAKELNDYGYSVFAPLLSGHGISEDCLRNGSPEGWYESVTDGINRLKEKGIKKVFAMGHSLGGIMSLQAAEQGSADGVITVAAPIKIYHYGRVKIFSVFGKKMFYPMNKPDGKENMFRYYKADGKSVGDLLCAVKMVKKSLYKVTVPAMIIFSRDDHTVRPESADMIYNGISSGIKEKVEITGDHHECIVEGLSQYINKINKFIEENS